MPTSVSPLLGLALPATGELTGTWGDVVNNQITSLLDSAIAGTTPVTGDADVTLTTTNLAPNEARQAIILASGARTAVRNIIVPAQSKTYIVINKTTGGFATVIKTAATPGVSVPFNSASLVAWDGSDFKLIANSTASESAGTVTSVNIVGGTTGLTAIGGPVTNAGTFTLGGVLNITNGGTGASTASGARASLGVQETLVSGTTIKTINGTSLLGSGDLSVGSGVSTSTPNIWTAIQTFYGLRETRVNVAAAEIDLALGTYFVKTVSAPISFTVTNIPASGTVVSFIFNVINGGSAAVTWMAGTQWAGGTSPTLTTTGRDVLGFFTYDGGTTWTGLVLGKDVK